MAIKPEKAVRRAVYFCAIMTIIAVIVVFIKSAWDNYEYTYATADGYFMKTECQICGIEQAQISIDYHGEVYACYVSNPDYYLVGDKVVVTFDVTGTKEDWYVTNIEK